MPQDRVTVSLDDDAKAALDDLVERTGEGQSAVARWVGVALVVSAIGVGTAAYEAGNVLGGLVTLVVVWLGVRTLLSIAGVQLL